MEMVKRERILIQNWHMPNDNTIIAKPKFSPDASLMQFMPQLFRLVRRRCGNDLLLAVQHRSLMPVDEIVERRFQFVDGKFGFIKAEPVARAALFEVAAVAVDAQ
jgi:hypothetical protein